MNRRDFLQAAGATTPGTLAAAASADSRFEWLEASAADLRRALAEGRTTTVALARAYTERIAQLDAGGPGLASILELNPQAEALATQLDAERAAGHLRGPLHGLPVVVKDNIATADRMATSAGSPALIGIAPPRDAAVVARLRAAGALILAKTNLSEWANFRGRNSISGWSTRGGQTHNPYALDRSPERLVVGHRQRRRGQPRGARRRHRDRWLDHVAGVGCRTGRRQADGRAGEP